MRTSLDNQDDAFAVKRAQDRAKDRARVEMAIERLSGAVARPERFLLTLAEAWGRPVPCRVSLGRPLPPVEPTERGVVAVARWASAANPDIQRAALSALGKAGAATRPVLGTIADALTSSDPLVRLAAVRVFALAAPCPEHEPLLRRALSDELFSVRWLAVEALASSNDERALASVLAASIPRLDTRLADVRVEEWLRAVAALGQGALPLLPQLREVLARISPLSRNENAWCDVEYVVERLIGQLQATQAELERGVV